MIFESATRTVLVDHQQRGDKYYQSLQNMWGAELTSFSLFSYHGMLRCRFEPYQLSTFFFFSTVFSLPEGKMLSFFGIVPSGHFLDIPNGILGMMFYSYILLRHITSPPLSPGPLSGLFLPQSNFIISSLAFASSLFLGRKLYLIKEICVLCLTTHILNTTLFYRAATEIFSKSKAGKHD
jgi:hypothetical protein